MTQQKKFAWGIALILFYFVYEFHYVLVLIIPGATPGSLLSQAIELLLFDRLVLPMISRLSAILGLLFLVSHYYHADDSEKKRYRALDRYLAVGLMAGMAVQIVPAFFISPGGPSPYIGFMRFVVSLRYLLLLASLLLWAYALWRAHAEKALLASVASLVLLFMPIIPYNNPHFMEESDAYWQEQHGADTGEIPMAPIDQMDMPPMAEEMSPTSPDDSEDVYEHVETSSHAVVNVPIWGALMPLLLLAYTWMRWGHHAYKRDDEPMDEED